MNIEAMKGRRVMPRRSRRPWRRSLELKLLSLIWALLVVVIAAYTWAAWHEVSDAALSAADERLARVAEELANAVAAPSTRMQEMQAAAARPEIVDSLLAGTTPAGPGRSLIESLADTDQVVSITLLGLESTVGLRVPGRSFEPRIDPGDRPPLPTGAHERATRTPLRTVDGWVFYDLWTPVHHEGQAIGALVERRLVAPAATSLETIERLIGSDAIFLIGNADGGIWTDLRTPVAAPPDATVDSGRSHRYERSSEDRFGRAVTVQGTPWAILIEFPVATVMAPARAFLNRSLTVGALLLMAGAGVAVLLGRRLIAPLHELSAAAEAIASGDYGRRVNLPARDEIGSVAASFNRMAEEVETARRLDASRRAAAEVARNHSEEYFQALVEYSQDLVIVVDARGRVRFASPSVQTTLGLDLDALEGAQMRGLVHVADWPRVDHALFPDQPTDTAHEIEFRASNAEGDWCTLRGVASDLRHNPVIAGALLSLRDVTDSMQLEEELRQAHKMEAVGRLAGGVAHDFNNLLTAMNGSLEFVMRDHELPETAIADLRLASAAGSQAADLVRQLLAFGRRQAITSSVIDPNETLQRVCRMLTRVVGEDIDVQHELDAEIPPIHVDVNQLEQVLLNLAVNARDAMPEGGTLTLSTLLEPGDNPDDDPCVCIRVRDSGVGMDEETRQRIFEPFFTTKPEGVGTGLGLSTVYGILSQSGARIEVDSEPGEGTTFDLLFPSATTAEAGASTPTAAPSTDAILGTPSSILVVEDQDFVAAFVRRALGCRGHTVQVAHSLAEARAILRDDPEGIDVLLTDVVLADGRGPDLVDDARGLRPDLPVLLMTGYDRGRIEAGLDHPVLEKPFTVDELLCAVDAAVCNADVAAGGSDRAVGEAS